MARAEKDEKDKKRYTQIGVAKILGWTDSAVSNYALLSKIDKRAWEIISTTFEISETKSSQDVVGEIPTVVGIFTEGLLRNILDLTSDQQIELVQALAHSDKDQRITKNKFTELAKAYQARNEMKAYSTAQLGDLGEEYTSKLVKEVYSGASTQLRLSFQLPALPPKSIDVQCRAHGLLCLPWKRFDADVQG